MSSTAIRVSAAHLPVNTVEGERVLTLASDILQGQSAIFLLIQASRAPNLDRLEHALVEVRGWLSEFRETDGSTALGCEGAVGGIDTRALSTRLVQAQLVLERFAPFLGRIPANATAREVTGAIAAAQTELSAARSKSNLFESIIGSCCAADVSDVARRRNQ